MSKNYLMNSRYGCPLLLRITDFSIINITLVISAVLYKMYHFEIALILSIQFSLCYLLFAEYTGVYVKKKKNSSLCNEKGIALSMFLTVALITTIEIMLCKIDADGEIDTLRGNQILSSAIWYWLSFPFLYLSRQVIVKCRRKKSVNVAIVGVTENGLSTEMALINEYAGISLDIAFYDERSICYGNEFVRRMKSPFRGTVIKMIEDAKRGKIDEIYVALPMIALQRIRHILDMISDTTVKTYIVPDFYNYSSYTSTVRSIHDLQAVSIFGSPLENRLNAIIKRTEDIVLGSIIMVLISLVMMMISIGVKITSPGPVFFKQDRYGIGGKKITVWKFRTMNVMENSGTIIQATKNDPRVTPFGAFLRRTSLDELPQFINVLQGSMSIVGPRPHAVQHNEQYRRIVDNYMIRNKVKPGITGLAQVNGYRGEVDLLYKMEKRVQYDIEYIINWSLFLDAKIIIKTIFKGFVGKNAY